MASVGALRVDLGLNSAEFQQGMKRAETSLAQFGASAKAMDRNAAALGATTARVMQRQAQLGFQLQDLAVQIQGGANPFTALLQQGSQVQAVYSGQGGLGQAFRDFGSMVGGIATKFAPFLAILAGATALFSGLAYEINKTADVQVGFIDVALAGFQLLAEGIGSALTPVWGWIVSSMKTVWDNLAPILKGIGNTLIGTFVGAFDAIKVAWGALPGVLGEIAYNAANNALDGIKYMVTQAAGHINNLIKLANMVPGVDLGEGLDVSGLAPGGGENPYAGSMQGVGRDVMGALNNGFSVDYLGGAFNAISERAQAIAAAKTEVEALGGSAKAANDNVKALAEDGMSSLADMGKQVASTLSTGFADLFKGMLRGTKSVTDALGELLGKLGDLFIDQAFNMLFSGIGGGGKGGGGGGIFGFLGGLLGFANGGSFQVGGSGGVDSQLVAFKASPNEHVSITKPGQERGGGGAIAVDVTVGVQDGALVPLITQVSGQVAGQQIKANNRQLPNIMQDINMRQG